MARETTTTKLKLAASLIADRFINKYDFFPLRKQGIIFFIVISFLFLSFSLAGSLTSEEYGISCYSVAVWPYAEFSFVVQT